MNESIMVFAKPIIILGLSFSTVNGLVKLAHKNKGSWSDGADILLSIVGLLFAAWI